LARSYYLVNPALFLAELFMAVLRDYPEVSETREITKDKVFRVAWLFARRNRFQPSPGFARKERPTKGKAPNVRY
jgi:hypothetical protein